MTKLQIITHMIEELPMNQKIKLVGKLERDTAQNRMDIILQRIDERIKKHPITENDIFKEVKAVRKRLYAKRYN